MSADLQALVSDPTWLAHRYDEKSDGFRFIQLARSGHRAVTFITDEYLENSDRFEFASRDRVSAIPFATGPVHYVFHSAYCCSTLVARAFDIEGEAMGLKEPQVLNDLLGWRRRGASEGSVRQVLEPTLALLSRPFSSGETTIIKPSNIVSPLAGAMLELNPDAKALFLFAPIESYLQSIAKKGLWGRRWVREVLVGTMQDGYLVGGFEDQNLLTLTDLQVAAVGWLSQHALFERLLKRFGPERIKTLDSATLLADQPASMRALFRHFELAMTDKRFDQVLAGPAFTTHSKNSRESFDADARALEQASMAELHAEEIGLVAKWAEAVSQSQGINMRLSAPLLN